MDDDALLRSTGRLGIGLLSLRASAAGGLAGMALSDQAIGTAQPAFAVICCVSMLLGIRTSWSAGLALLVAGWVIASGDRVLIVFGLASAFSAVTILLLGPGCYSIDRVRSDLRMLERL